MGQNLGVTEATAGSGASGALSGRALAAVAAAATPQLEDIATTLPTSLTAAVRAELRRAFHPPFETPIVVAVNGALMSSCWFFLPTKLRDQIFTIHGSLAFGLVLAFWMYSDVPATNVLGPDRHRVLAAFDDRRMLRRLLAAKNVVLWLLIAPLCSVITLAMGAAKGDVLGALLNMGAICIVPFGALGLSGLVGVRWPYHPMPLRYRWEHRKPVRRMLVRWLVLATTPYVLVPVLATLLLTPSLVLWGLLTTHGLSHKLPHKDLGWGLAIACALAAVCWIGGNRASVALMHRRREQLIDFLNDPGRA